MKKIISIFILGVGVLFAPTFQSPVKADTVQCYCGFWGTCKIGGNGGLCFTYDSNNGGSCTSQNGNCGLFNPKH